MPDEQPGELQRDLQVDLPAPYEVEAPVDDVALVPVALGLAALLVMLLTGPVHALGPAGGLVGVLGLAVAVLVVRRRARAPRVVVVGALLSAAAVLLSAVLVAVAAVTALARSLGA